MCVCVLLSTFSMRSLCTSFALFISLFLWRCSFASWVVQIVQEVSVILGKKESHVMNSFFGDLCEER
jgi:Ca2+/H+ antiporter